MNRRPQSSCDGDIGPSSKHHRSRVPGGRPQPLGPQCRSLRHRDSRPAAPAGPVLGRRCRGAAQPPGTGLQRSRADPGHPAAGAGRGDSGSRAGHSHRLGHRLLPLPRPPLAAQGPVGAHGLSRLSAGSEPDRLGQLPGPAHSWPGLGGAAAHPGELQLCVPAEHGELLSQRPPPAGCQPQPGRGPVGRLFSHLSADCPAIDRCRRHLERHGGGERAGGGSPARRAQPLGGDSRPLAGGGRSQGGGPALPGGPGDRGGADRCGALAAPPQSPLEPGIAQQGGAGLGVAGLARPAGPAALPAAAPGRGHDPGALDPTGLAESAG